MRWIRLTVFDGEPEWIRESQHPAWARGGVRKLPRGNQIRSYEILIHGGRWQSLWTLVREILHVERHLAD